LKEIPTTISWLALKLLEDGKFQELAYFKGRLQEKKRRAPTQTHPDAITPH